MYIILLIINSLTIKICFIWPDYEHDDGHNISRAIFVINLLFIILS